jgi:hypothetical protein
MAATASCLLVFPYSHDYSVADLMVVAALAAAAPNFVENSV